MTMASPPFRCATSGDNHLGGDDWDQRIVSWLIDQVKAKTGADLSKDLVALQRLKEAGEEGAVLRDTPEHLAAVPVHDRRQPSTWMRP